MAVNADELYSNLNKLLNDICKFLTDENNYENLSPIARKHADELIARSKTQLQEIAKVSDEDDGAYVDMEKKTVDETPTVVIQPQINPYSDLPAKDISHDIKYGTLSWKCRIILTFEKYKKIYAAVHENWLLVYSTEKDLRPLQTFYLRDHKAQVATTKCKNSSQIFELVCTSGESKGKLYYFVAITHKDMLQWTAHINRCHENLNTENDEDEEPSEDYDMIGEGNENEEEEEIYHDIDTYYPDENLPVNKPPDLPQRRFTKPNTPLPPLPRSQSVSSSESSTYDAVVQTKPSLQSSQSSFSEEDEEENIYQEFVSPENLTPVNGFRNEEKLNVPKIQVIQDDTNKKSEKPKTLEKPRITQKPKHFSFRRK